MSTAGEGWRDASLPHDERVELLLGEMTAQEQMAQLGSCWAGNTVTSGDVAPMQSVFTEGARPLEEQCAGGLGHLTRVFGTAPIAPAAGVERVAALQATVMAGNRFGLPAIVHEECLTGFTAWQATVYPAAIAWGASWDAALVEEMAASIGRDLRGVGVHQGLSPLLDVVRDYRWGRVEETIGEDPLLVGTLGTAYVRGLQREGVAATPKHFAGYPAARAGRNHAPVSMGMRELREVMLFPFEMAVRLGGAKSIMNSYSDIDGIPAGAHRTLLTDILRGEWGFTGTLVSDYWSIAFLRTMHRIAATNTDAGALALAAGIDVELPDRLAYGTELAERFADGGLDPAVLREAARRVLRQKASLGMLDAGWSALPAAAPAEPVLDGPANRDVARRLAERSVILLDNASGVLPLGRPARVAVIGPVADDALAFMGCYSFPNHVLPHHPGVDDGLGARSLLAALRDELVGAQITFVEGVPLTGADRSGIAAAVAAAAEADAVVVAVGDRAGLFGMGTSGEGTDTATLRLPGLQHELVDAVLAAHPRAVVVAVTGRPYALADFAQRPGATVQAFMPGVEGGGAIAGVLSGRLDPAGHLPVQIPRLHGPQPSTYLQAPLGLSTRGVSNLDPTPAYTFGHGLGYSSVEYGALRLDASEITDDGTLRIEVDVTNTGGRVAHEVVQVYLTDRVAQTVRPAIRLVAFARVDLAPGATRTVVFALHADVTSFVGLSGTRIVEPGVCTLRAGASAGALPLRADFTITGRVREVGTSWTMTAQLLSC